MAAAGGGVTAVVAERWRCIGGGVATADGALVRPPCPLSSSRADAGSGLSLNLLLSARGMRGGNYETNVHHGVDVRTPRTMKSSLSSTSNIEVVLRHFHRHCY
jgi:hypothetical protein